MEYNISTTHIFRKQFDRLCKKYPSLIDDINALKQTLLIKPIQGESLGHGLYMINQKKKQ